MAWENHPERCLVKMELPIQTLLVNFLTFLSAIFFFLAIFVPIVIGAKKAIKERSLESSDLSIKLQFLFFFLGIISSSILLAVKDPQNTLGAILTGVSLTIMLIFYGGITLLLLERIRGKGSIKRFFHQRDKKSQSKRE